ncbi:ferredoxin--NADP reductase [Plasmodium sp. DRC-Itaito]|uniref:ferredoxin--NADP(+) reductase n=1 Tax=Plasmodium gaboni TaxID=647221 RepID=A0ABY1UKK9_9APIC|nr:ferredoxin--NADP reductase [Plasmodium gaboni]SOV21736.1 ferredoxin--NADP reductase [Plasmodium sp. DRC-Itaito]
MKIHLVLILPVLIRGVCCIIKNVSSSVSNHMTAHLPFLFVHNKYKRNRNFKLKNNKDENNFINIYTVKNPLKCKVVDKINLVRPNSPNEVYHLEINHNGLFKYVEGHTCGIIPYYNEHDNKTNKEINKDNNIINTNNNNTINNNTINNNISAINIKKQLCARLYSISSSNNTENLSVAVKIHKYKQKENDSNITNYGYCSGFIKNLKINDDIYLTGAHGYFNLPNDAIQKNTNFIFIATGTGISPYISFLKKLFAYDHNNINNRNSNYTGHITIYYGVYNEDSILYLNELEYFQKMYPNNINIHYVFSYKQNSDATSFYVQDEIYKRKTEFLNLFNNYKCELYICGHKSIRYKVMDILKSDDQFDANKKKRVHVEVY